MLPYNQDIYSDVRYLKQVRLLRNLTLKDMERLMNVDQSTLSKLENGQLDFTPIYYSRFETACKKIRLSNIEIASLRKVIELKEKYATGGKRK